LAINCLYVSGFDNIFKVSIPAVIASDFLRVCLPDTQGRQGYLSHYLFSAAVSTDGQPAADYLAKAGHVV